MRLCQVAYSDVGRGTGPRDRQFDGGGARCTAGRCRCSDGRRQRHGCFGRGQFAWGETGLDVSTAMYRGVSSRRRGVTRQTDPRSWQHASRTTRAVQIVSSRLFGVPLRVRGCGLARVWRRHDTTAAAARCSCCETDAGDQLERSGQGSRRDGRVSTVAPWVGFSPFAILRRLWPPSGPEGAPSQDAPYCAPRTRGGGHGSSILTVYSVCRTVDSCPAAPASMLQRQPPRLVPASCNTMKRKTSASAARGAPGAVHLADPFVHDPIQASQGPPNRAIEWPERALHHSLHHPLYPTQPWCVRER